MARLIEKFLNICQFYNLSCIKYCYTVCDICNHTKVMCDKYDGVIEFLL